MRKGIFLTVMFACFFLVMSVGLSEASNPCNPCNPCSKKTGSKGDAKKQIRAKHITDYKKLVAMGKKMWNDESLNDSGMSCMTCHADHENLNLDKYHGLWPHNVKGMTDDIVTLSQMINYCLINPMESKPLDYNSIHMTAMTAYYREYIKTYKGANPCSMKNNPCNPCSMKKKNPCNPCGR